MSPTEHSLPTTGPSTLTERQRQVLELLADGRSNAGIAAVLFVSEKTVEVHLASAFATIGLLSDRAHNRRVLAARWWLTACGSAPGGRPGHRA